MTEHIREEQLALYAWGDLPPQESSAITAHLQDCGQCQKVLADFHETRSFVTTSLQNPRENELSEVRRYLTANLQPQRRSERHWTWWGAGIAAALALFVLPHSFKKRPTVTERSESLITSPLLTESMRSRPAIQIPLTPITSSHPRHLRPQRAGIRTVTLIAKADQEPIIRMTTADPNVVILWQSNNKTKY